MSAEKECDSRLDWKLLKQGAEARVYSCMYLGKPAVVKERFVKTYRLPELDKKLTHRRMSQEVRSMARCRKHGIRAPAVFHFDATRRLIVMEHVTDGTLLKDYITSLNGGSKREEKLSNLVELIGSVLAQMHDIDLIHGDLTTSNMIFNAERRELTLIDFGLSYVSSLAEDKGVDLYVLERAFLSSHPNTETQFQILLDSYTRHSKKARAVVQKLDEVRTRGRKRTMVG
ncbi:EKC/KEOPS complex subunit TP53RK [Geodia barretti]|uniref:non-specific serine/threonine protein kinase n=1 Tax=Geodia barretti TaxID=519541 RepID=A0AA35TKS8_GEOBA|nr:EKC/KEOPS complex subunit TP53RK [Geodia barretti]